MNFIKICQAVFLIAIVVIMTGCPSSGSSSSGGTSMDALASQADAQTAAKKQEAEAAAAKAAADQKAAAAAAQAAQNPPAPDRKAVGSREIVQGGGYYSAIMGARRHVMNVADAIAWIQGVRSFKAEEGRKPKNTDEFMKVVVPKYDLQLPRIEADEEYLYDPDGQSDGDFGQLYVVKKATPADATGPSTPAPGAPVPGGPAPGAPAR